jgi:purine-cytosine permease-like protein
MPDGPSASAVFAGIERHSIDYVPLRERHGSLAGQAQFWFLGNFNFGTIAIGFIGPGMGLSLWWTILAETLGILIGTIFQAFHASQGAELGLPQMIQSRAQFGYRGVVVPLFGAAFTFIGFNILNSILLSAGLFTIAGWNRTAVCVSASMLAAALAIWGHDSLHRAFKVLFWMTLPLFMILSLAIPLGGAGGGRADPGGFHAVGFFTQIAAGASYNITYAIFVSDYTRYLPATTGRLRIIATVFAASSLSAIWLIGVGAWIAVHGGSSDPLEGLLRAGNTLAGGFGTLTAIVSMVSLIAVMGMNAYSAMLTTITAIDAFRPLQPTRALRIWCIALLAIGWTALAVSFGGDIIDALNDYFVVMLYLLVPWTAVNLTDYFFVRHGHYAVTELFVPHGIYRAWGAQGLGAYAVGAVASLPFCVLPGLYIGPAARALGGVDIGWLVGLVVTAPCYLWLMRGYDAAAEGSAIALSGRALEPLASAGR